MSPEKIASEADSSPELNRNIEEMLLSCERVGEGSKAVVLRLSINDTAPELQPALEALNIESAEQDQAIKLFKLSLPGKSTWEYEMQTRAYDALQAIPEEQRKDFALIPALSSKHNVLLDDETKAKIEERFRTSIVGNETELIAMEYIPGEDIGTIYYKWVLERENLYSPEEIDQMTFPQLYEEVSGLLRYETLPSEMVRDPRALELAEWKNTANNTNKLYEYLQRYHFPFPKHVITQVENTYKLLHKNNITHGDAFERNLMISGGIKTLREKGSLDGEQAYAIDFGESKDHAIDGLDEFAVVRRMKKLTQTKEGAYKAAEAMRFKDLETRAEALRSRDKKWQALSPLVEKTLVEDSSKGLNLAWNRTVGIDGSWVDRFFILMKDAIENGASSKEDVAAFVAEKKSKMTPFQSRTAQECLSWLEAAA